MLVSKEKVSKKKRRPNNSYSKSKKDSLEYWSEPEQLRRNNSKSRWRRKVFAGTMRNFLNFARKTRI